MIGCADCRQPLRPAGTIAENPKTLVDLNAKPEPVAFWNIFKCKCGATELRRRQRIAPPTVIQ